jgi:hypothetical protein
METLAYAHKEYWFMRFEVHMAVNIKIMAPWNVMPWRFMDGYQSDASILRVELP